MMENNSFTFHKPCSNWEIIQMPSFLFSCRKFLVAGNYIQRVTVGVLKYLEFLLPPAPLCCF